MDWSDALSSLGVGEKKKKKEGEQESPDVAEGKEGESGLPDAAIATGNPYAMAVGAGLKVLGARAKRQKERTQALASSVNSQQSNMSKGAQAMSNVASGFRL